MTRPFMVVAALTAASAAGPGRASWVSHEYGASHGLTEVSNPSDPASWSIQSSVSAVFDGTNFFVVWMEGTEPNRDIYGARVSPAGSILDPGGIPICTWGGDQRFPRVAWDGRAYLVVWEDWQPPIHTLTVNVSTNGPGTVTGTYGGTAIAPDCTRGAGEPAVRCTSPIPNDPGPWTTVRLTGASASGLWSWSSQCAPCLDEECPTYCDVKMDGPKSVTATFAP